MGNKHHVQMNFDLSALLISGKKTGGNYGLIGSLQQKMPESS